MRKRSSNAGHAIARFLLLVLGLVWLSAASAQQADQRLDVALAECPPFVVIDGDRHSGLAVWLWEQVGGEMGLSWDYSTAPLGELLNRVQTSLPEDLPDVGITCASVTAEREQYIDFSHSFTETYTAIAVRETTLFSAVVGFLTSPAVIRALLIIIGVAAAIGAVFWLLEHNQNKKLFAHDTRLGRLLEPLIIGLMFITNGPIRYYRFKTLTARTMATVLTLSSTFMIAAITAVLASSFTLNAMKTDVRSLEDLRTLQVGALESSTSSALLRANGIVHTTRGDLATLVEDLDAGRLEAVVSDAAFLQYHITRGQQQGRFKSLTVLPYELQAQNYAFMLQEESELREGINRALLSVRIQEAWRDKVAEYLGQ